MARHLAAHRSAAHQSLQWSLTRAAGATLVGGFAMGCAPAMARAPTGAPLLYVASGLDGTITRVDAASGRRAGGPLPAGANPWQVVPGPNGSVLTLSGSPAHPGQVTHVFPEGGTWAVRMTTVRTRGRAGVYLAGDGGRYVAALSVPPSAGVEARCVLTVIDLAAEMRAGEQVVCAAGESPYSLALAETPDGPAAYVGLWHAPEADASLGARHGVVLAVALESGRVVGRGSLPGVPEQLVAGSGPGRWGQRLYAVEGMPGPELRNPGIIAQPVPRWRLLGLDPTTMEAVSRLDLSEEPSSLALAPDGNRAYALGRYSARRSTILEADLVGGVVHPLVTLPGECVADLVVTESRVYVAHLMGDEVWAVDRRLGRVTQTIPVGRHPTAMALRA